MKKTSTVASAILAAALASAPAAADTVTTNAYDAASTSSDIDVSCKDLQFDQGNIEGECNYADGDDVSTQATTLVREDGIACASGGRGWKLHFSTEGDPDEVELRNAAVVVSTDGRRYRLKGLCYHPTGGNNARVELTGGIGNSAGDFVWTAQ